MSKAASAAIALPGHEFRHVLFFFCTNILATLTDSEMLHSTSLTTAGKPFKSGLETAQIKGFATNIVLLH